MNIIKKEFENWGKFELIFFITSFLTVFICSLLKGDEVLALLASLFGLVYTFSAGKGKIYCYFFGIISTVLCGYIALRTSLFGTSLLYFLYYLPMEIWGIIEWKKHLIKDTNEIIKTHLNIKGLLYLSLAWFLGTTGGFFLLSFLKDSSPIIDSLVVITSICAMYLTVKRCIEQWGLWTIVNLLSIYMWFEVYLSGEKTFSIFLIRIIYFILGIYFFWKWKKSIDFNKV